MSSFDLRQHVRRYAIWKAYGQRCFYCCENIRYREFEVDHIIPQTLAGVELQQILEASGLPQDWNIQNLENLVAACSMCNRKKSDRLSSPRQMILLTTGAKAHVPIVEALIERYTREDRSDKVRAFLEQALLSGDFTSDDFEKMKKMAVGTGAVSLTTPINFADIALSELSAVDIARLREQRLNAITIEMQMPDKKRRTISSVADYDRAKADCGFAITATDLRCEGHYKNASAIFQAVALAEEPARSFIRSPRVGVCDIELLPASLLQSLGPLDEWAHFIDRFDTIADLVRSDEAIITQVGSAFIQVKPNRGLLTSIMELLRADLDGDGIEDILIAIHGRAIGGSHGHSADPVVLSRHSEKDHFAIKSIGSNG